MERGENEMPCEIGYIRQTTAVSLTQCLGPLVKVTWTDPQLWHLQPHHKL